MNEKQVYILRRLLFFFLHRQIAPQQSFLPTSIETEATRAESEAPGAGTGCGAAGSDVDIHPRTQSESSRKGSAGSSSVQMNGNNTFPCHKRNASGGSHGRIPTSSHSRSSSVDTTKR